MGSYYFMEAAQSLSSVKLLNPKKRTNICPVGSSPKTLVLLYKVRIDGGQGKTNFSVWFTLFQWLYKDPEGEGLLVWY